VPTAREPFPRACASLGFLGDIVPISDDACLESQERRAAGGGEGDWGNSWSLLSRPPVAGRSQSTEPPVARRLYDPKVDGTGYQVRVDNHFDPAAAAAGRLTRAGVIAVMGYGPESVDPSTEGVSI
jgi:hypothetical protein